MSDISVKMSVIQSFMSDIFSQKLTSSVQTGVEGLKLAGEGWEGRFSLISLSK
jgi:hypothetical protein